MTRQRSGPALLQLWRDSSGVSAIEFAIAAPLMFIFILISIEFGMCMILDATLQVAASAAGRYGLTIAQPSSGTREAQAQAIVMGYLGGWANIPGTSVSITETNYGTYANVGTPNSTGGMGALGDVVSYNIAVTSNGLSGILPVLGLAPVTFQRNYIVQNEK